MTPLARTPLRARERGRAGESYVVAGEPRTLVEAFELAERITRIPTPKLRLSASLLRFLAAVSGSEVRCAAPATYLASNAKAKRELGLAPRALEEGVRGVVAG